MYDKLANESSEAGFRRENPINFLLTKENLRHLTATRMKQNIQLNSDENYDSDDSDVSNIQNKNIL